MNDVLARDPDWRGHALVSLSAADVECRYGEFEAEPDILYKRTHFQPSDGSANMVDDIVDVKKAVRLWQARLPYLRRSVSQGPMDGLEATVDNVELLAAVEYYVHEAGHCLGYATADKYASGYFRVNGKTLWPLVYVEELRADLLAFGIAGSIFHPELAAKVFWYNVLLRLGTHVEHLSKTGREPYGSIPFMLFACLYQCGLIDASQSLERGSFEFVGLSTEATVSAMRSMAERARRELVERACNSPTDAAIDAARFYQKIHHEAGEFAGLFERVVAMQAEKSASLSPGAGLGGS